MDDWDRFPLEFFDLTDLLRSELEKGIGQPVEAYEVLIPKRDRDLPAQVRFAVSVVPNMLVDIPISPREPLRQEVIIAAETAAERFKEKLDGS